MRKTIVVDEYYPFHILKEPDGSPDEYEVPDELVERYIRALQEFNEVQGLLEAIYQ